jgi:hypothetical protein
MLGFCKSPDEAARALTAGELAGVADHLETVIAETDPQKAKALCRLLIDELRVNSRAEILPTYRLVTPEVCAMSEKVEAAGIEPASADAPERASTSLSCDLHSPGGRFTGDLPTG